MSTLASPLPMRHSASVLARLNGPWHRPALWTFAGIVLAHWAEHVVQAWQIWGMGMPRHHALGVLGMAWPWLVHSEWLHYGYAVIMLAGLLLLRPGMAGRARTWWGVAVAIQFWHHVEHALLLGQALTGWRLGGGPQPSSILQLLVPRVELHLFYNALVFVPMVIGMAYHLLATPAEAAKAGCSCARRVRAAAAGLAGFALLSVAGPLRGQAADDAVMMPSRALGTGIVLAHESWDRYWEGNLKRGNENIGRLSTRTATWVAAYGVTGRLTLLAALPYVETRASRGTLKEMHGVQDVSMAAKYRVASAPTAGRGRVSAIVAGAVGIPVGDYSPDFLPLSIGLGSRRVSGRFTVDLRREDGWFLAASTAYTWRANVKLDRAAYYTGGELHLRDEVRMPDVFDYTASAGYRNGRLHMPLSVTVQRTRGGSDIRRQDMPFLSNRMNFVRLDGAIAYTFPPGLMLRAGAGRVLTGRNVGQATTFSAGLLCTLPFSPGGKP